MYILQLPYGAWQSSGDLQRFIAIQVVLRPTACSAKVTLIHRCNAVGQKCRIRTHSNHTMGVGSRHVHLAVASLYVPYANGAISVPSCYMGPSWACSHLRCLPCCFALGDLWRHQKLCLHSARASFYTPARDVRSSR